MAKPHSLMPSDTSDPNFDRKMLAWTFRMQGEMHELIMLSRETIAATKLMIAEADRMLGRRQGASVGGLFVRDLGRHNAIGYVAIGRFRPLRSAPVCRAIQVQTYRA
jgi:hypothetical protein